jgi:hypothetical protein
MWAPALFIPVCHAVVKDRSFISLMRAIAGGWHHRQVLIDLGLKTVIRSTHPTSAVLSDGGISRSV